MKARLFASLTAFTLEDVLKALNQKYNCEIVPKGKTRKVLLVKSGGVLVMEANVFDDVANRDTISDMARRKETFPDDFGNALRDGSVKFMLCTVNGSKAEEVAGAIDAMVAGGIITFETTNNVQAL